MLFPEGVAIDGRTGEVSPSTHHYRKTLSDLRGFFRDSDALETLIAERGDLTVYEVTDYRKEESDLAFGTTVMWPGKVGDEFFLTRGHFHVRRDCGEAYYTQSGSGILLLESRAGESRIVEMKPGICAFIPPEWAHRSINTGREKLVFTWFCATDAGHEYGEIQERGMRRLVLDRGGKGLVADNPNFAA
jgi:glucose-6-phosphate isomerase